METAILYEIVRIPPDAHIWAAWGFPPFGALRASSEPSLGPSSCALQMEGLHIAAAKPHTSATLRAGAHPGSVSLLHGHRAPFLSPRDASRQDRGVKSPEAAGIGNHVHPDDLPSRYAATDHHPPAAARRDYNPNGSVDQGRPSEPGNICVRERFLRHGRCSAEFSRRARRHCRGVGEADNIRVEYREKCFEIAGAQGSQESVHNLTLLR